MVLELYFRQYCSDLKQKGYNGPQSEIDLLEESLIAMKPVAEWGEIRPIVESLWEEYREPGVSLFLWKETGEGYYLEEAKREADGFGFSLREKIGEEQRWQTWKTLPFFVGYDVLLNEKRHLNDTIGWIKSQLEASRELERCERGVLSNPKVLWSLLGCFQAVPEQSYEQYRYLGDRVKEGLREFLAGRKERLEKSVDLKTADFTENALAAAVIFKGCRLGLLQWEKYEQAGEFLLASAELGGFVISGEKIKEKEKSLTVACMLAWAEEKNMKSGGTANEI